MLMTVALLSMAGGCAAPTPSKTPVFDLAALAPAPAVLYLARIGQFQPQYTGTAYQTYWSAGRLGPEAVLAADEAVTAIKERTVTNRIYLVGFSGGGGLACLVAARRDDVAGLLDHDWWTRTNNYPPLTDSLNPADFAAKLADIPQIHFYGMDDKLISPAMSAKFESLTAFKDFTRAAAPAGTTQAGKKPGRICCSVMCCPCASALEIRTRRSAGQYRIKTDTNRQA